MTASRQTRSSTCSCSRIADRAPKQTDPRVAVLVDEQRRVIAQAADRKAAAARAGVIGSCTAYR